MMNLLMILLQKNNYFPFGQLLPNRHGSTDSYRYGFQGQEKDDEIKGEGNSINFKYRMYDPRIGRFFAEDPMVHAYPWYTPYQFSGNTPIMSTELEGLEPRVKNGFLVGYTIQAGDGPTQIAANLNDPDIQKEFGYTLQKVVDWTDVVKQNETYYTDKGRWGTSDMFDINNPTWNNLNSNKGETIVFKEAEKKTTKPIIDEDAVVLDDNDEGGKSGEKYLIIDSSFGDGGRNMGMFEPRAGDVGKHMDISEVMPGGGLRGGNAFVRFLKAFLGVGKRVKATEDAVDNYEKAEEIQNEVKNNQKTTFDIPTGNIVVSPVPGGVSATVNKTVKEVDVKKKDSARTMDAAIKRIDSLDLEAKKINDNN